MANVWANSVACHPRATCHTAGCCHLANSVSWSQSHMPHSGCCHLANSTACHSIAMCHTAWCYHLVNSVSWSQSHLPHFRVLSPGKFHDMSSQSHVPHCRVKEFHLPYWKSFFAIFYYFVFQNTVWPLASGGFHIVFDTLVQLTLKKLILLRSTLTLWQCAAKANQPFWFLLF